MHRFAVLTAIATFLLIVAGGLVTSTGSGLAVPDWPLSFGQFFPPMVGGVLFEHGHRMVAGFVGFLTLILAVWVWLKEPRREALGLGPRASRAPEGRGVKVLAAFALAAVVLQALLGGVTVLHKLPVAISVSHACLGQVFFCLVVSLALVTSAHWPAAGSASRYFQILCLTTTIVLFLQLVLGAWMRHMGAALAIADFPLAFGRLIPPFENLAVSVHFAHRVGAFVVLCLVVLISVYALKNLRDKPNLLAPALLLACFTAVQIVFGALIIWSARAVTFATAHVAAGALVLATSVVLTLRLHKIQF